jgi:hypothetical protein
MHDSKQEVEFETGREEMANDLVVGDNVVVCENSTLDESLWLLVCDKHVHYLKESFTHEWGTNLV